ncbi:MAG: hypothetical protein JXA93_03585 [Anaerolineae bacterium]|nr:hypothetical protein [Anaerolineae bacterium]
MPDYTLTALDTTGIQNYVFGSNVLRENIGASELVWRATRLWPFQQVRQIGPTNVRPGQISGAPQDLDPDLHIERDGLAAEVIYAGGGNCFILFSSPDSAPQFVANLTRQAIEQAPGLNLVAAHLTVHWDQDDNSRGDLLACKVGEALEALARKKRGRRVSMPMLGVGTTVACQSTGLPAVGTDPDEPSRPLAAEILAKLAVVDEATERLSAPFHLFLAAGLRIPRDFDDFGREAGEISYIAVVHADGNNMGRRVEARRQKFCQPDKKQNRAYIDDIRQFSQDVEEVSTEALEEVSGRLLRHWDPSRDRDSIVGRAQDARGKWRPVGQVQLGEKGKDLFIPFRPIVFGGDDLTFVTDGRLGLSLTAAYLEAFEKAAARRERTKGICASAGVAVVKTHYPFARAYELAADLCGQAKSEFGREHSAFDWHFAAAGLFGSIDDIRRQQYTIPPRRLGWEGDSRVAEGRRETFLEMRPVLLYADTEHPQAWRAWPGFAGAAQEFLLGKEWKGKRNKVIALREALRQGPDAVDRFQLAYNLAKLPSLAPAIPHMQTTGWDGISRCGYFDVIEALNFYLALDWGEEEV